MGLAGIMDGQDMGMLKPRREPDLSEETLGPERGHQFRAQHLERNRPVVSENVGQKHRGHATPSQLALEPVSVRQAGLELLAEVCHSRA
jgi:hypothetical protein